MMRSFPFLSAILFACSVCLPFAFSQTESNPDPVVVAAAAELDAIRSAYAAMKPGDGATANALMQRLNPIGSRLGQVADKTHPAWAQAATLYNQLNNAIPAKYRGEGGEADPALAKISEDLARYETKLQEMAPGDLETGKRYLREIAGIATRINAVTTKFHPSYKEVAKRYNALNQGLAAKANQGVAASPGENALPPGANPDAEPLLSYQLATYKRLERQVRGTIEALNAADDAAALAPDYRERFLKSMANYQTQLDKINRPDHPDVARLIVMVDSIPRRLDRKMSAGSEAKQALGDFETELAAIQQRMQEDRPPATPAAPYEMGMVKEFIERTRIQQQQTAQDLAYLESLRGSPFAPDNLSSRIHWVNDRIRTLQANIETTMRNVPAGQGHDERRLEFFADPKNDKLLVQDSGFAERAKSLAQIVLNQEAALLLYQFAGDAAGIAKTRSLLSQARTLRDQLDTRFASMLGSVRMPSPASTASTLLRTAKGLLVPENYEDVNPTILRYVINSAPVERSMTEGDFTSNAASITLTAYEYKWTQFQVATAEEEDGKYYIYYNTLKYFTSGGNRTPLNRWILSGRLRGSQILKENISK